MSSCQMYSTLQTENRAMSLSNCFSVPENRSLILDVNQFLMDNPDAFISAEEVVKTSKVIKKRTPKVPNSKFYKRLLECLDKKLHLHMLRYVPNSKESEFEVVFTDRKDTKGWNEKDISLFLDLDEHLDKAFARKTKEPLSEIHYNDCKGRFRARMAKIKKHVEMIHKKDIKKCKTIKRYKILWRPDPNGNTEESTGNEKKAKRKSYKRRNKKNNKSIDVPIVGTKNFERNSTVVYPQEQLKNDSEGEKNIIWDNFFRGFEKKDLNKDHYSCLLDDSEMVIDGHGNIVSKMTIEDSNVWSNGGEINVPVDDSLNTDVGIHALCGNSEIFKNTSIQTMEISSLKNFEKIMICENMKIMNNISEDSLIYMQQMTPQLANLNCGSIQSNIGDIQALSNVNGYGNGGFEENQNLKHRQECVGNGYVNGGIEENLKHRQECVEDNVMEYEASKPDSFWYNVQNEPYVDLNRIGEKTDDFANKFISLGNLYGSS